VGKFAREIVDDIVKDFVKLNQVAVVCSARSSKTKSEGTTSRLIRSADLAADHEDYGALLDIIEKDHIDNCGSLILLDAIKLQLVEDIKSEIRHGRELLHACQIIGEISPRSLDSVMSIGEKLSCIFMTALMKDHGLKAVYIDLSDLIPLSYDFTDGFNDEFYKYMAREIGSRINQATEGEDDVIPVITGFWCCSRWFT